MCNYLEGIGISNYRSFGPEIQYIGPLTKMNLFIGANNSGKSNILTFIHQHLYELMLSAKNKPLGKLSFKPLDHHLGDESNRKLIAFGMDPHSRKLTTNIELKLDPSDRNSRKIIDVLLKSRMLSKNSNLVWWVYESTLGSHLSLVEKIIDELLTEGIVSHEQWNYLWSKLSNNSGGNVRKDWIPGTLKFLSPVNFDTPKISIIPAIRNIGEAGTTFDDNFSGLGLIDRLAQLQNPSHDQQEQKKRFEQINDFLRTVTGNNSANLEIPYDRNTILVHIDNKTLPLNQLGTGIHEVIILAAAATLLRNQIVCIEEPELHAHPLLQKRLIRYLSDSTDNQYFISTHSAHLLDTPNASIFHVRLEDGDSKITYVSSPKDRANICLDLGYRPSDLMQANCIIWVEGPSDRIYLNYWINALEPDLVEGLHYSIMFYGGRLLNHLSADDPELNEFISLRRLNRHIAIVIDSDKDSPRKRLNPTKKRVSDEFDLGPGFAWITKGREIENYIDPNVIESSIKQMYPRAKSVDQLGMYDKCYRFIDNEGHRVAEIDKVKLANKVTSSNTAQLDLLDLKQNLNKLIKFILAAND